MQLERIETDRLVIRPLRESDREAMIALLLEDSIYSWLGSETLTRLAGETAWKQSTVPTVLNGVVEDRNGRFCGRVCLQELDSGLPELGVALVGSCRGQGLGTEAVRAFAGWYGRASGADRLLVCIEPGNEPSRRLFTALGAELQASGVEKKGKENESSRPADVYLLRLPL